MPLGNFLRVSFNPVLQTDCRLRLDSHSEVTESSLGTVPGQGWAANEAAQQYDEMKVARKAVPVSSSVSRTRAKGM